MKQDNDEKDRSLGLSPAQVAGSALAAMSGAFFVSWAGTAGTLIGAAVGSVIATVGAATYTWSLRRTSDAAKRTAAVVKQRALVTGTLPRSVAQGPLREDGTDQPMSGIADADQPPSALEEPDSPEGDAARGRWDLPWGKVVLASLAVMIAGLAGMTAVEAVTGKPISSFFGRDDGTGTTVGQRRAAATARPRRTTTTRTRTRPRSRTSRSPRSRSPPPSPGGAGPEPLPSTPTDPSRRADPTGGEPGPRAPARLRETGPRPTPSPPEDGTVQP